MAAQDFGDEAGDMIFNWFKELIKKKLGDVKDAVFSLAGKVLEKAWHEKGTIWDKIQQVASAGAAFNGVLDGVRDAGENGVQVIEVAVEGKTPDQRAGAWDSFVKRMEQAMKKRGVPEDSFSFDGTRVSEEGTGTFSFDSKYKDCIKAAMTDSKLKHEQAAEKDALTVSLGMKTPDFGTATGYAERLPASEKQVAAVEKLAKLGAISKEDLAAAGEKAGWTMGMARRLVENAGVRVKVPMYGMNPIQIAQAAAALRDELLEKGFDGVDMDFDFEKNALKVETLNTETFEALIGEATQEMQKRVLSWEIQKRAVAAAVMREQAREVEWEEIQKRAVAAAVMREQAREVEKKGTQAWTGIDPDRPRPKKGKQESFEEKIKRAQQASDDVKSGKTPDPTRSRGGSERGETRGSEGRSR